MKLKNYRVIYREYENETHNCYICCTDNRPGEEYRIITIHGIAESGVISAFVQSLNFCDFMEAFYLSSQYCIVFKHRRGTVLSEKLSDFDFTNAERYNVVKSLMEEFVARNMPPEIAVGVLSPHSILIRSDNTVSFCYDIPATDATEQEMTVRLAELIKEILDGKMSERMAIWWEKLYMYEFSSLCEAYFRLPEFEEIDGAEETPTVATQAAKIALRISEVKEKAAPVAAIVISMIIPAALAFLLLFLQGESEENDESGNISAIGMVEL